MSTPADPVWWVEKFAPPLLGLLAGWVAAAIRLRSSLEKQLNEQRSSLEKKFDELKLAMAKGLELEFGVLKEKVERLKERDDEQEEEIKNQARRVGQWMSRTRHALGRIEGALGLGEARPATKSRPEISDPPDDK